MLTFDIAMPLTLFLVTLASSLLSKRVEGRLKSTLEEREFRPRDTILFVVIIVVALSVVAFVPQMALLALFLFSYSSLLFTFSYLFSSMNKERAVLFISVFFVASLMIGTAALLGFFRGNFVFYGGFAAYGLAVFASVALLLELRTSRSSGRWHLAALPPALFLVVFFVFSSTPVWFPYLFDAFGVVFAILVTLYLSSLFTWKTTFMFAALLTIMDFVLVLMIPVIPAAVTQTTSLGLPVVIYMPIIPPISNPRLIFGLQANALGLGDFFFAGTLATQTLKKFGKRTAIISAVTMSITFGIFLILLLSTDFNFFPGTLMIIFGWIPVVAWKWVSERKKAKNNVNVETKI